jgi:hypothetical protein
MIFVVGAVLLPRQQAKLGPGVAAGGCTRRRLRTWSRESRIPITFALAVDSRPFASKTVQLYRASPVRCGGVSLVLESAGLAPTANSKFRRLLGLAIRPRY